MVPGINEHKYDSYSCTVQYFVKRAAKTCCPLHYTTLYYDFFCTTVVVCSVVGCIL